jgi:hypothetical protein
MVKGHYLLLISLYVSLCSYLSVSLPVSLCSYLSISLPATLCSYLSVSLLGSLCSYLSVSLLVSLLSVSLPVSLCSCLRKLTCLSYFLPIRKPICLLAHYCQHLSLSQPACLTILLFCLWAGHHFSLTCIN